MIDAQQLAAAFARNARVINRQCDGLTHDESLLQAPFRANCLNWVLGHLVYSRAEVLEALGVADETARAPYARYDRDGDPITHDGPGVVRLEDLLAELERQGAALTSALTEPASGQIDPEVAATVFSLYFHETWHSGQTELLRQLAGRDDKVI